MKKNLVLYLFIIGIVALIVALMLYVAYIRQSHDDNSGVKTPEGKIVTQPSVPEQSSNIDYSVPENQDINFGEKYYEPAPEVSVDSQTAGVLDIPEPVNEPGMEVIPNDTPYEPVEFSELELLAGYIKYATNFEDNYESFLDKAEVFLRDYYFLPEALASDNMRITNAGSTSPQVSFTMVDDLINSSSTLFCLNVLPGHPNRVDRISLIQSMVYSSYSYLSTGETLIMYRNSDYSKFLLTSVAAVDGIPCMTSYIVLQSGVSFYETDDDIVTYEGFDFTIKLVDNVITFVDEYGVVVLEGIANEGNS